MGCRILKAFNKIAKSGFKKSGQSFGTVLAQGNRLMAKHANACVEECDTSGN